MIGLHGLIGSWPASIFFVRAVIGISIGIIIFPFEGSGSRVRSSSSCCSSSCSSCVGLAAVDLSAKSGRPGRSALTQSPGTTQPNQLRRSRKCTAASSSRGPNVLMGPGSLLSPSCLPCPSCLPPVSLLTILHGSPALQTGPGDMRWRPRGLPDPHGKGRKRRLHPRRLSGDLAANI